MYHCMTLSKYQTHSKSFSFKMQTRKLFLWGVRETKEAKVLKEVNVLFSEWRLAVRYCNSDIDSSFNLCTLCLCHILIYAIYRIPRQDFLPSKDLKGMHMAIGSPLSLFWVLKPYSKIILWNWKHIISFSIAKWNIL